MTTTTAKNLKPGDRIMPPPRELRLWMRRHCAEKGLPEVAMVLTVADVREGKTDKGGAWLIVTSLHAPEWTADYARPDPALHPFRFKVRPGTPWQLAVEG